MAKCITDIEGIVTDAEAAVADIKSGNIADGVKQVEAIVAAVESLKADCTAQGFETSKLDNLFN